MNQQSLGMVGDDVGKLQVCLKARGYNCGLDTPGVFGHGTHNAVLALQARAQLPITGVASLREWTVLGMELPLLPDTPFPATIPFYEARYWKRGVVRARVDLIVIHSMEAPESSTRADVCAKNMRDMPSGLPVMRWKSAHYFFDCDSIAQGVHEENIAYHAPGVNPVSIGFEHAGYARQTQQEWLDDFSRPMLRLSSMKAARVCQKWGIEPEFVDGPGLLLPHPRGITTHACVTEAFKRSTHTDPGREFPMEWYVSMVWDELQALGG